MRTKRHKRQGDGDRAFQPGKGSAERSSKWRQFYSDIFWRETPKGFERVGRKQIKRYPRV